MGATQVKQLQSQCGPACNKALFDLEEWDERRFDVLNKLFHYQPVEERREAHIAG